MLKTILLCFAVAFSVNLCAKTTVLAFAGSTREGSVNKKLVRQAAHMAKMRGADVQYIDLRDYPIPFYDADLEASEGMPENAKRLRHLMISSDVILIASPEYNGSVSALLKNALDWASRGESGGSSRDAFKGKQFIVMSAAPGGGGGARGLAHLRAIIEAIGGVVNPQFFIVPSAYTAFDGQGNLNDPKLATALLQIIESAL